MAAAISGITVGVVGGGGKEEQGSGYWDDNGWDGRWQARW